MLQEKHCAAYTIMSLEKYYMGIHYVINQGGYSNRPNGIYLLKGVS